MPNDGHAFWERTAGRYDLSMALLGGPLGPMCERVARSVRGRERVLELAAGTGLVTRAIAPEVGQLLATDYSEAMVAKLRERAAGDGLENVSVEVLDVFELDDPEGFDAIVAANVLHLLPDINAALDRIQRALKPGGLLVVPTYCHAQNMFSRSVSGVMGLVGFPGQRRLTLDSLESLVAEREFLIKERELLSGLLPIGYVEATRLLDK